MTAHPTARWFAAALLLAAAGVGIAQTTQPASPSTKPAAPGSSTRPAGPATTAPATRPARLAATTRPATAPAGPPSPLVLELIGKLSSPEWRVRDKAASTLVPLGDDARPAVEQLIRTTESIDARTAGQNVLRQMDDNRAFGPSFITLHLKDVSQKEAFAELARQSFIDLKTYPDNLFENDDGKPVSIDIDRKPFWTAMRELTEKTGLEIRDINNQGPRLQRGAANITGRTSVQGAFLIVANQINRTQNIALAKAGVGRQDQTFGLQLLAYAEPKLTVLKASNVAQLEEVVDDKGNSLIPANDAAKRFGGYYGAGVGSWNLYCTLEYPKNPGKTIKRLRANATFTVQTKSQKIEVNDLLKVSENVQIVGGSRVVIREFKKTGEGQYMLRIVISQDVVAGGGWEQLQNGIQNRLKIMDANGQSLDQRGWGSTGRATELEMNMNYAQSRRNEDGRMSGEPVKLVWTIPTETRDLTIPFEFNDLPMP